MSPIGPVPQTWQHEPTLVRATAMARPAMPAPTMMTGRLCAWPPLVADAALTTPARAAWQGRPARARAGACSTLLAPASRVSKGMRGLMRLCKRHA